ncbi:hypothetical protein GZL_02229 [Streptomyces sp. 769]|nr:hypothetical protein GZL_02229 [Streptomyces sp. 769]
MSEGGVGPISLPHGSHRSLPSWSYSDSPAASLRYAEDFEPSSLKRVASADVCRAREGARELCDRPHLTRRRTTGRSAVACSRPSTRQDCSVVFRGW